MNLTEQTVSGTNQVSLQDSLNAALLKLKVTMGANSVAPTESDLLIYVDKVSQENPTEEKRQYLFELAEPLRYCNSVGDELLQEIQIINNDPVMVTKVNRKVGVNEDGSNYVLETPQTEEIDSYPVTMFEGVNYIYSNYSNVSIEILYPKNTDENKVFLNNAMYHNHKLKNDGEFSLDDIYFKDAFTKTEDKLNLEVNNASVDCITSRNNKFSLDSEGNLIVNTINGVNQSLSNADICNLIYPVGSIYLSINNTNPSTLFGGTWTQISQGRFLLGVGSPSANTISDFGDLNNAGYVFASEDMGGQYKHTLTISEMPSHTHTQNAHNHGARSKGFAGTPNTNGYYYLRRNEADDSYDMIDWDAALSATATNQNTGGSASHNNTPPYFAAYMWKRVS